MVLCGLLRCIDAVLHWMALSAEFLREMEPPYALDFAVLQTSESLLGATWVIGDGAEWPQ
jgi:hypothetical protein